MGGPWSILNLFLFSSRNLLTQFFESVHRVELHASMLRDESACVYMSLCVCIVFLQKERKKERNWADLEINNIAH